jgi:pimeloyl-ACP methyl ester carboxylesterase
MTGLAAGAAAPSRLSFSFAACGGHAAWLVAGADAEPMALEVLHLRGGAGRRRVDVPRLGPSTQPLALDDGRVLLCQHDGGGHRLVLVDPPSWRTLAEVEAQGMRIFAPPARRHAGAPLAYAVTVTGDGASTLWRVDAEALTPLLTVPALLTGQVWLDTAGTRLAANRILDGLPSDGVVLDLASGACDPFFSVSPRSNDRVLAYSATTGLIAVSTDATGRSRVGCGVIGRSPVRFPGALHLGGHDGRVLGVDPAGRRLLVCEERGAASRLSLYDPDEDAIAALPVPAGAVVGATSWNGPVLRVPWSAPTAPHGIAELTFRSRPEFSLAGDEPDRWAPAHLERLAGPDGPIEAVVYGGPDWRRARRLVVALHGGPLAHWLYAFDGLLQSLAAAGVAVVAPNQRGSTGYGAAHMLAIRGDWGGPDLADVRHLAHELAAVRRDVHGAEMVVMGASYGGFLALLAAQTDPELWAGCVALAPFLSAARLDEDAGPPVRRLIERLGGRNEDRDALAGAESLGRLLLIHGVRDDQIPVAHSRALHERLRALGRAEAHYFELDGEGHDLAGGRRRALVHELVTRFCRNPGKESR